MTHTVTHTAKVAYGMGGANSLKKHVGVKQKGLKTLVYQRLDVSGAVGKDEVGSSNLPSSSRKQVPQSGCLFLAFMGIQTADSRLFQIKNL